jgi:ribosomal protein S21
VSINIEVTLRPGESGEKLIKRFSKKCKKQEVIQEYLDKTSFFRTKSQKKRDKVLKNKYLREKNRL